MIILVSSLKSENKIYLVCQEDMDSSSHDWNFVTAFLPDQSLYDKSNWSWKQWQEQVERSSEHQQSRIMNQQFSPRLQRAWKNEENFWKFCH